LPLCATSRGALETLFAQFPASEAELLAAARGGGGDAWGAEGAAEGAAARARRARDEPGEAAGRMSAEECLAAQSSLESRCGSPAGVAMAAQRAALPIAAFRAQIVATTAAHQVTVLAGQTGCGKTTQVPQYLLEAAWAAGRPARILCTQPRRISAVSVAERVAAERGERAGDPSSCVGYSIRLESRAHARTALLFCTNGVLLRKLTQAGGGEDGLEGVSHIVVDEVHERDLFADFLAIILRDVLPRRPALRLVLMSATLNEGAPAARSCAS